MFLALPPLPGLLFTPYKDTGINMDWNTGELSSAVVGRLQPVLAAMPAGLRGLTWAFATGECGAEQFGGFSPASLASANVDRFVQAGRGYIVSTGGANGAFTCGTDHSLTSSVAWHIGGYRGWIGGRADLLFQCASIFFENISYDICSSI